MFRFNIPITKVDEERRLVYGLVTEEVVDQAGEILDYETSKAYFQQWSDGISKATGGASLGNLRLMHQPVIAGKLTELTFDDVAKQIACVAKIVDDAVWNLVLEGCLTGFSMGGKYIKRWKDAALKGIYRFTAKPVEVSVVDNPCVSTATFEYIKSDGSIELRKFHTAGDGSQEDHSMFTQEQIAAKAAELAKAAGTPDATDQFMAEALVALEGEAEAQKAAVTGEEGDDAEKAKKPAPKEGDEADGDGKDEKEEGSEEDDSEAEKAAARETALADAAKSLVQVWQAPDGSTFSKKADGAAHILTVAAPAEPESAVEKALRAARGEAEPAATASPLADLDASLETAEKALAGAVEHVLPLTKGLYEVRELASVLQQMRSITTYAAWEAKSEGDGSPVPAQLMDLLRGLGQTLIDMTTEEVTEMLALVDQDMAQLVGVPEVMTVVELAAQGDIEKFTSGVVEKAGARNSKADMAKLQTMHDHSVALGASCDTAKAAGAETPPADDVLEDTDLVKSLRADNTRLGGEVEKAISGITELGDLVKSQAATITELSEKVEKFGKSPQPLPPRSDHVVVERMGKSQTIGQADIEKMSPDERADLAIRLAQTQPQHVGGH